MILLLICLVLYAHSFCISVCISQMSRSLNFIKYFEIWLIICVSQMLKTLPILIDYRYFVRLGSGHLFYSNNGSHLCNYCNFWVDFRNSNHLDNLLLAFHSSVEYSLRATWNNTYCNLSQPVFLVCNGSLKSTLNCQFLFNKNMHVNITGWL